MNHWYLSKKGQALGPLSTDKLIALIQSGEVNHLDLVYRTGDDQWLPVAQIQELASYLIADKKDVSETTHTPHWVLLKKLRTEKGSEYRQLGPFSEEQVLELLDQGEVRFSDFAWKKGLENWVQISQQACFTQPLPSSVPVDETIYDKTQPDLCVETLTTEQKESLTQLVDIHHYKHQDRGATQVTESHIPLNSQEFATESGVPVIDSSIEVKESGEDLWSLDPVQVKKQKNELKFEDSKKEKKLNSLENRKAPAKSKKNRQANKFKDFSLNIHLSSEKVQWAAAGAVFLLAVTFLYLSFRPSVQKVSSVESLQGNTEIGQELSLKAEKTPSLSSEAEKLESAVNKIKKGFAQTPKKEQVNPKEIKKEGKAQARSIASLKEQPKNKSLNKKPQIKKKAKKKTKSIVKKKSKAKKKSSVGRVTGSKKNQSFYKHRERKALFYSSIRAETLAVDIERQYRKLRKNKGAWKKYYRQWKKKVRISLAKEIRAFPEKNQKYAYPKIMASFKKDYDLFYKYGETFDTKVKGARAPSGAPKNIKKIFSRYKKRAQSLGR